MFAPNCCEIISRQTEFFNIVTRKYYLWDFVMLNRFTHFLLWLPVITVNIQGGKSLFPGFDGNCNRFIVRESFAKRGRSVWIFVLRYKRYHFMYVCVLVCVCMYVCACVWRVCLAYVRAALVCVRVCVGTCVFLYLTVPHSTLPPCRSYWATVCLSLSQFSTYFLALFFEFKDTFRKTVL